MTHFVERTALILLAGTALSACAAPSYPIRSPLALAPPSAAPAAPASQIAAVTEDRTTESPWAAAPVESRPLTALPPAAPAPAEYAVPPTAVDAAARSKSSKAGAYTVRRGDTLGAVAARMGTDIETLARLNGLKKPYRLTPGQVLKGPQTETAAAADAGSGDAYEVRPGDTLSAVADRVGSDIETLAKLNDLRPPYRLIAGQTLKGPGKSGGGKISNETYVVQSGDTLSAVADRMGSDVETLAKLNDLRPPYRLVAGQTLQGPRAAVVGKTSDDTYVVQPGDTLFGIAQKLGISVDTLQAANGMGNRSSINAGQTLRLSGEVAPPTRREPAARASRPTPPAAQETSSSGRSATGRVVDIQTPGKAYKVKRGDTLEKIARTLDSDIDELAKLNRLKRPYVIHPGQTLRGPGGSAKAYVVARGDSLAEIAQRFRVTEAQLRSANGLRRNASVAPGRKLRLPAGYRDRGPITASAPEPEPQVEETRPKSSFDTPTPVGQRLPPPRSAAPEAPAAPAARETAPPPSPASQGLPSRPQPYRPSGRSSSTFTPQGNVTGAPVASAPVSDAQIMQLGRGRFAWPIRGELLSGFGSKGGGQSNDGVNIRANTGDPVRAAADGEVVYAGDQVPGFGNLVLIKHADGWVTAYGHLSKVEVRMQEAVSQGQEIGEAGSSGGVSSPQVHFEVRYAPTPQERARPVDPGLVLPR